MDEIVRIKGLAEDAGFQVAEMFGLEGKGEDTVGAIHEFGKRGHIPDVHFRIMRALCQVNSIGPVLQDHVPRGVDSSSSLLGNYHDRAVKSCALGCIRAMIQAAQTELDRRT